MSQRRKKHPNKQLPQVQLTRAQALVRAEKNFERFRQLQDEKLKALSETLTTVWGNQLELSKSETRLDEQFCVLARLSIKFLNDILIRIGSEDLITEKVIEDAFKEWALFKSRTDFREFMVEWFLGKALSSLPPAPIAKEIEPPGPKAEGSNEFGGNYAAQQKSDERNETAEQGEQQDVGAGKEDAVPEGQNADSAAP